MDFAFLVHSRNYQDVEKKFKLAKFLPRSWVEFWCLHWPPVVVAKITGLKCQADGEEVIGWLIGIPMTAKQILDNKDLAKKKIIKAIKKAQKLGAELVGLGALTSSVTNGGKEILDKVEINITTGNSLTSAVTFEHVKEIIKEYNLDNQKLTIAIVGATGSVGQSVTKLLVKNGIGGKILLLGRTRESLENLLGEIKTYQTGPNQAIEIVENNIERIVEADLIVVVTSAINAIIQSRHLKSGAIIYDVTQPQNVSMEVKRERTDVKIFDGGLVAIENLKKPFPLGMGKDKIFSCLGETITLALEDRRENFSIGKVSYQKSEEILKLASKNNISPNRLWD